jgi:CMP-N-acetylneuraminic acid synthetase
VIYATAPFITPKDIHQAQVLLYKSLGMKYAYSVDSKLQPTGGFYYGYTQAFIDEIPLERNSVMVVTNDIDINTPEDWELAEKMYENN